MTFPSIQSATDYVKGNLSSFYRQGDVLVARLRAVTQLIQQAKATGDQEAMGKLIVMQAQVKTLLQEQINLEQQLKPFAEYFGIFPGAQVALGLLPLVLTVGAVTVASLLYLHFEKIKNQATALDMIAKGMLKPEEAASILNQSLFSFGSLFTPGFMAAAAGVAGLYVYINFFSPRRA